MYSFNSLFIETASDNSLGVVSAGPNQTQPEPIYGHLALRTIFADVEVVRSIVKISIGDDKAGPASIGFTEIIGLSTSK